MQFTEKLRWFLKGSDFSGWIDSLPHFLLRKYGFLEVSSALQILGTSKSKRPLGGAIYFETPLSDKTLKHFNLSAESERVPTLEVYAEGAPDEIYAVSAGADFIRIPNSGAKKFDPPSTTRFLDPFSASREFPVQYLVLEREGHWKPVLLSRRRTGEERVVAATDGRYVVCGAPILSLALRRHWMPPTDHPYFGISGEVVSAELECLLIDRIVSIANRHMVGLVELCPWPNSFHAALTIRHDYDRSVSDDAVSALLSFYEKLGVKSSWGFLPSLMPAEQMAKIASHGHEIVLHTARTENRSIFAERDAIEGAVNEEVRGITTHGGVYSLGHTGENLFREALDANFAYADLLSRSNGRPHPAILSGPGQVAEAKLMLAAQHLSLDVSLKEDQHRLAKLLDVVPKKLNDGDQVTIMNHPDIHQRQLIELLSKLDLSGVWKATHREVLDWYRIVHFESQAIRVDGGVLVRFPQALPLSAKVKFEDRYYTIEAGATECLLG